MANLIQTPAFIFRLPIPKTQKLSFEDTLKGVDNKTQEVFQSLSNTREEMRTILDAESMSGVISVIEKYMPSFFGLMIASEPLPPQFSRYLRIIWNTSVCLKYASTTFVYAGFRFEVVMCLISYGIALRNLAKEELNQTNFTGNDFDEKSKSIVNYLCRAAGVFDHISQQELAQWKVKPDISLPETMDECYIALSELCIAEAQEITVKKGLLKGTSKGALSKLTMDISQKYDHAFSLLNKISLQNGVNGSLVVLPTLLSYLSINATLWKGITFRLLAQDNYSKGSYGLAVAYASQATIILPEKKDPALEPFIKEYQSEQLATKKLYETYKSENDSIYYEQVPNTLVASLPEAKCIMKVIPFQPPSPQTIAITQQKGADCVIQ